MKAGVGNDDIAKLRLMAASNGMTISKISGIFIIKCNESSFYTKSSKKAHEILTSKKDTSHSPAIGTEVICPLGEGTVIGFEHICLSQTEEVKVKVGIHTPIGSFNELDMPHDGIACLSPEMVTIKR